MPINLYAGYSWLSPATSTGEGVSRKPLEQGLDAYAGLNVGWLTEYCVSTISGCPMEGLGPLTLWFIAPNGGWKALEVKNGHEGSISWRSWRQNQEKIYFAAIFSSPVNSHLRHVWHLKAFFDVFVTFWGGLKLGNFKWRYLWTFGTFRSFFKLVDKWVALAKPTWWQINK